MLGICALVKPEGFLTGLMPSPSTLLGATRKRE